MRRVTAAPGFWDRRFADGRFNRVVRGVAPEEGTSRHRWKTELRSSKMRPWDLQNEALGPPQAPRAGHFELVGALLDALGDPRALCGARGVLGKLLGILRGGPWGPQNHTKKIPKSPPQSVV